MSAPDGAQGRLAALSSPPYRRFWLGSLASVGATQLILMGQGWLVFELSGRAIDLAVLGAVGSLPTILVTLAGGVVADRVDRRRVLLVTTPLSAALLGVLALLDVTDVVTLWHVWLVAALFATVSGFDWPARQAIFTALIERSQMMSAIALNSVVWQGTRMVMPAIGGVLVAAFTTASVFALGAIGFLAMLAVLPGLPSGTRPPAPTRSWPAFVEGVAFIARTRLFAVLIPLTYLLMFFGTSYIQLMPLIADRLGAGAEGYGLLISASGVGSILGTVVVSSMQRSRRLGRIMLRAALGSAVIQIGFALLILWRPDAPWSFAASMALIALIAACSSSYLVLSMTALQLHVPEALRGRVMSLHGITFSLIALGALFGGGVASLVGAPAAVATGGCVVAIGVVLVWLTQPAVRDLAQPG